MMRTVNVPSDSSSMRFTGVGRGDDYAGHDGRRCIACALRKRYGEAERAVRSRRNGFRSCYGRGYGGYHHVCCKGGRFGRTEPNVVRLPEQHVKRVYQPCPDSGLIVCRSLCHAVDSAFDGRFCSIDGFAVELRLRFLKRRFDGYGEGRHPEGARKARARDDDGRAFHSCAISRDGIRFVAFSRGEGQCDGVVCRGGRRAGRDRTVRRRSDADSPGRGRRCTYADRGCPANGRGCLHTVDAGVRVRDSDVIPACTVRRGRGTNSCCRWRR